MRNPRLFDKKGRAPIGQHKPEKSWLPFPTADREKKKKKPPPPPPQKKKKKKKNREQQKNDIIIARCGGRTRSLMVKSHLFIVRYSSF